MLVKKRILPLSFVAVFFVSLLASTIIFTRTTYALSKGVDTNEVGCTGLGQDYSSENPSAWNDAIGPSDFRIVVVDRATLIVQTTSPDKTFLKAGGTTLGDVFGEGGCIIKDGNLDDDGNPKTVWENLSSIASVDAIYYDGNYNNTVQTVEKSLGAVDPNRIESFGLTLVIRTESRTDFDDFMVLDSGGWSKKTAAGGTDDGEPMQITNTNIVGRENYNIVLKVEEVGDKLRLVTPDGRHDFEQGIDPAGSGQVAFLDDISDPSKDYVLIGGFTLEQLRTGTSLIDLEYFNDVGDSQGTVKVAPIQLLANVAEDTGIADATDATAITSSDNQPSCERDGGEWSWALCPALRLMDDVISYLDNQVNSLLKVPQGYYENDTIRIIWQRFRDIAYLLLIPTILIMVIGTALGFQFLDAYTVKRALPRMLVAVIFIALSLPILQIVVSVINTVGTGLYGLITSVVSGGEEFSLAGLFDPNPTQGFAFTAGIVAGAALFKIWIGAAALLAISVLISIATIFLLLAFRQLLIVSLMIFAPVAILAWIFPGNDKPWKLWWTTLWKLLLLYPLIMALLGVGRVFAYIVDSVSPGGLIEVVLKLVAYIGPFFFIPAAFKYAGGVFANLGGIINDKERGVFDRLRKGRQKSLSKGSDKFLNEGLYQRGGFVGRKISNAGLRLGSGKSGNFGFGEKGRQAMALRAGVREQENLKNNPMLQQLAQTDDDGNALLALSGGTQQGLKQAQNELMNHWIQQDIAKGVKAEDARKDAEARIARATSAVKAVGLNKSNAGAAMIGLAQNKSRALEGDDGLALVAEGARRLSDGNQTQAMATLQGYMYHARGNGRQDHGDAKFDSSGKLDIDGSLDKAWAKQSIGAIVTGDTRSMETFARQIDRDWRSGDTQRMSVAAQRMSELQGAMSYATEGNQQVINRLLDQTVQYNPDADKGLEDQMADIVNASMGLTTQQRQRVVTRPHSNPVREARGETETVTVTDTVMVDRSGNVVQGGVTGEQIAKSARKFSKDTTEAEMAAYRAQQYGTPGAPPSDKRLKRNIELLDNISGINVYKFQYIWSDIEYIGVMAQEILNDYPECVIVDDLGYYRVDYNRLPVKMTTYEEYLETRKVLV